MNEKTKDRKSLYEEIGIPEGIIVSIDKGMLIMKKNNKELNRKLNDLIDFKIDGNKIIVTSKRNRKKEKKLFRTFIAHIKNMIKGLEEEFRYKLQIVNVHFPMKVNYNKDSNELIVKNFLGEKKDRVIKLEDVNVKIDNDIIELTSHDIEKAGLAATIIENGVKVSKKDRRIFQDGIFLIEKPSRNYL